MYICKQTKWLFDLQLDAVDGVLEVLKEPKNCINRLK